MTSHLNPRQNLSKKTLSLETLQGLNDFVTNYYQFKRHFADNNIVFKT